MHNYALLRILILLQVFILFRWLEVKRKVRKIDSDRKGPVSSPVVFLIVCLFFFCFLFFFGGGGGVI